jgi:CBS domain containing-hemolysin-like protein
MIAPLLIVAILLVPVAGLFAAADAALNSVSRAHVESLVREGTPGARALAKVVADRPRHVNLLLLLRLAAETTATVLVTVEFIQIFATPWVGALVAAGVMVVVSYVFIGVGPRTLGRQHPYRIGMVLAGPVRALGTLLGPLSRLLIVIGNMVTPGQGFREGPFSSEIELRELVDMASTSGVVDEGERQMIHSVFELGDTFVRLALKSGYSRLPVLGEGIDDIVGVAYLKDLVQAQAERPEAGLSEVMRRATFVPDSKRVDELLKEMQAARNHMAIVVDEYGGTAGVVTIEDILEEIVGEITDEYDTDEVPAIQEIDGHTRRLSARLPVEDLEELYPYVGDPDEPSPLTEALAEADVDTVGGLLAQRLGKVPLPGAEAEVAGLRLRAEGGKDARGRLRITSVLVEEIEPEEERADDAS